MPDIEIPLRRLRPAYDALDSYNNKQALKITDMLLKKTCGASVLYGLKALALVRMDRGEEALPLLQRAVTLKPVSENALQVLTMAYCESYQMNKIPDLYRYAVSVNAQNEELWAHLHMACVRIYDYEGQQVAANTLFKGWKHSRYFFWGVMSITMQVYDAIAGGDSKKANGLLLPLAERMMNKHFNEKGCDSAEQLLLQLDILRLQGKTADAVIMLDGPLGNVFQIPRERKETTARIKAVSDVTEVRTEAVNMFTELLRDDPDCWSYYMSLFDMVLPTEEESVKEENLKRDEFNSVKSLIDEVVLAEDAKSTGRIRGPYLARMEFLWRIDGSSNKLLPQHVGEYVRIFGSKVCAFADLQPTLRRLRDISNENVITLLSDALYDAAPWSTSSGESRNVCLQQTTLIHCLRFIGADVSRNTADIKERVADLLIRYIAALPLGANLESKEIQFADGFALLAAYMLVEEHDKAPQQEYSVEYPIALLTALAILRSALLHSSYNYNLTLLAARVLYRLGAYAPAEKLLKHLEIKNVQCDSLGYLFSDYGRSLAHHDAAELSLSETCHFVHNATHSEVPRCTVTAYQNGTLSKIVEFSKLQERLSYSLEWSFSTIELLFVRLIKSSHDIGNAVDLLTRVVDLACIRDDLTFYDGLHDNADYSVPICWEATYQPDSLLDEARSSKITWIKLRVTLLLLVRAALAGDENVVSAQADVLFKLTSNLTSDVSEWRVQGPNRSLLSTKSNVMFARIIATLGLAMNTTDLDKCKTLVTNVSDDFRVSWAVIQESTERTKGWPLLASSIERIVSIHEAIAIVTLMLTSWKSRTGGVSRKKKSAKASQVVDDQTKTRAALGTYLVELFNEVIGHCEHGIRKISEVEDKKNDDQLSNYLGLSDKDSKVVGKILSFTTGNVLHEVYNSHLCSLRNIKEYSIGSLQLLRSSL